MRPRNGFTLVELLVVIGIIAVLVGILLPMLTFVRHSARNVMCRSNLREIGNALRMYANDNHDVYPDAYTTGGAVYRMAPGQRNVDDPSSLPETYGLPAVLHGISPQEDLTAGLPRARYLAGNSRVWVCPAIPDFIRDYGNTYFWNQNNKMMGSKSGRRGSEDMREVRVVQDNVSFLPYPPGFRKTSGPQPGITPSSNYIYPHPYRARRMRMAAGQRLQGAVNVLFLNGQVGTVVYTYGPSGLNDEVIQ